MREVITLTTAARSVHVRSNLLCKLWRGQCGVGSLPYTASAGFDIAAAGVKLALAQDSTSVSSDGPMRVG